ncbi:MAG: hypothetical protein ACOYJA_08820 [Christensenellales bacterium]|jgi:hypothetical protein
MVGFRLRRVLVGIGMALCVLAMVFACMAVRAQSIARTGVDHPRPVGSQLVQTHRV